MLCRTRSSDSEIWGRIPIHPRDARSDTSIPIRLDKCYDHSHFLYKYHHSNICKIHGRDFTYMWRSGSTDKDCCSSCYRYVNLSRALTERYPDFFDVYQYNNLPVRFFSYLYEYPDVLWSYCLISNIENLVAKIRSVKFSFLLSIFL